VTEFIPSVPLCTALPPWARFTPEARMASFPYIIRVYDKSRYTRRPPFMKNVVLPVKLPDVIGALTPVAGLIFETKNRAIFLERFFWRDFSGEKLLPVQLCSH